MKRNRSNLQIDVKNPRLSLRSETIAHLSTVQLTKVIGGAAALTSWEETVCGNTSEGCLH